MKVTIDISPLVDNDHSEGALFALLKEKLGLSVEKVRRKIGRAKDAPKAISTELLAALYDIAVQREIDPRSLIRWEPDSLFSVLPPDKTWTYLGAYQPLNLPGKLTTSIADFRAARAFARKISDDFRRLQYAPRMVTDERINAVAEKCASLFNRTWEGIASVLSLGSPKVNSVSEWIMAKALSLTPFRSPALGEKTPFMFLYPQSSGYPLVEMATLTWNSDTDQKHGALLWGEMMYSFQPARSQKPAEEAEGCDYAIVLVQCFKHEKGNVVVGGVSAPGTLGASLMVCKHATRFDLSGLTPPYVRVFLVEVRFTEAKDSPQEPTTGRILGYWSDVDREHRKHEQHGGFVDLRRRIVEVLAAGGGKGKDESETSGEPLP